MPHVYQSLSSKTGRAHPLWRYQYIDYLGCQRKGTGTTSRAETERIALQVQAKHYSIRAGAAPAPKLSDGTHDIAELIEEYLRWGESQGGRGGRPWAPEHARKRRLYLGWWKSELKLQAQVDLVGCQIKVERAMRGLMSEKDRSGKTVWNRVETLVALCNWLVERDYLESNPLRRLHRINTAPRVTRRTLTVEEIQSLLDHASPEHRLLYETAICTGLRAGELRSLTVADIDVLRGGLRLHAEWTKNRKDQLQIAPQWLLEKMVKSADGKPSSAKLLWVPDNIDRTFKQDLERAGIPRTIEGLGKVDFHALRVTYVSLLDLNGASAKTSMELARHSTPTLTMQVYARASQERLRVVVEQVGGMVAGTPSTPQEPNGLEGVQFTIAKSA